MIVMISLRGRLVALQTRFTAFIQLLVVLQQILLLLPLSLLLLIRIHNLKVVMDAVSTFFS